MNREVHVRICEGRRVRLPPATRRRGERCGKRPGSRVKQGLHGYYESVRQRAPHRYSVPHGVARSGTSLSPPPVAVSRRFPHVPRRSRRSGSHRLHAGHHLAGKRAPSRLVPGLSTCPGFDASQPVSTRQRLQRSRLPDPRLTREPGLFPHRSPRCRVAGGSLTLRPSQIRT